jgi:hypothetical protein
VGYPCFPTCKSDKCANTANPLDESFGGLESKKSLKFGKGSCPVL